MKSLATTVLLGLGLGLSQVQASILAVNQALISADYETGHWTSGYAESTQVRANFQFKNSTDGSRYGFTQDYNNRVDWQTFSTTNEFARSGDYSVKFYSNPNQAGDAQPYRTEIEYSGNLKFALGSEMYYSASYRPGANWATGPKTWTTVISQWKIAGGGRPAFSLGLSNDGNHQLSLARAYGDGSSVAQTPLGTLALEEWTDFVFYFKWSSSIDGVAKIWKNGLLIHDWTGRTWYDDTKPEGYMQLGMYTQLEWAERTMHIDNVRMGSSKYNNNLPTFTSDPIVGVANGSENVAYTETIAGSATDLEGGQLTYVKTAGPTWLQVAADGMLTGTPGSENVGVNTFTIRVADGDFGEDTATLQITVDTAEVLDGLCSDGTGACSATNLSQCTCSNETQSRRTRNLRSSTQRLLGKPQCNDNSCRKKCSDCAPTDQECTTCLATATPTTSPTQSTTQCSCIFPTP